MARYRKVDVRVWNDAKFRGLSGPGPNAQTLWFFLMTGPQTTNIPGVFSMGEAAMAEALGWAPLALRKKFAEIELAGMAKASWADRVVWVPNAVRFNVPESPNVIRSWKAPWDELPECPLKTEAYFFLKAFAEGLGEGFGKAFRQALGEGYAPPIERLGEDPSPNQKQEQKQEPEQEQEQKKAPASSSKESLPSGATLMEPTTEPDSWGWREFWAWCQCLRQKGGFLPEKPPPKGASHWWSTCLMTEGVTTKAMQLGFSRFGQSKHWESATPPYPFNAFMSEWVKYVRPEVSHGSAATA